MTQTCTKENAKYPTTYILTKKGSESMNKSPRDIIFFITNHLGKRLHPNRKKAMTKFDNALFKKGLPFDTGVIFVRIELKLYLFLRFQVDTELPSLAAHKRNLPHHLSPFPRAPTEAKILNTCCLIFDNCKILLEY